MRDRCDRCPFAGIYELCLSKNCARHKDWIVCYLQSQLCNANEARAAALQDISNLNAGISAQDEVLTAQLNEARQGWRKAEKAVEDYKEVIEGMSRQIDAALDDLAAMTAEGESL